MEVFAVTIFVSLLFGILFAVLFVIERSQRQGRSLEQQALLPLDDSGMVFPVSATDAQSSVGRVSHVASCESQSSKTPS